MTVHSQTRIDSLMEAVVNTAIGFLISWAVFDWIAAPFMGFHANARETFGITGIITVSSVLRQYVLRRMFDGRSPWHVIKARFVSN